MPFLEAAREAVLGLLRDHFERPVDGRDEVDLDDLAEILDRVEVGLALVLVQLDREGIARDAGRRHADIDGTVLMAQCLEHLVAESRVRGVALESAHHAVAGLRRDLVGDLVHRVRQVDQSQGTDTLPPQLGCGGPADTTGGTGDDCDFTLDFHALALFVESEGRDYKRTLVRRNMMFRRAADRCPARARPR